MMTFFYRGPRQTSDRPAGGFAAPCPFPPLTTPTPGSQSSASSTRVDGFVSVPYKAADMAITFEDLEYQRQAVAAVVGVLDGQVRNTFERANLFGIHANVIDLTPEQVRENMRRVIAANGIPEEDAHL